MMTRDFHGSMPQGKLAASQSGRVKDTPLFHVVGVVAPRPLTRVARLYRRRLNCPALVPLRGACRPIASLKLTWFSRSDTEANTGAMTIKAPIAIMRYDSHDHVSAKYGAHRVLLAN